MASGWNSGSDREAMLRRVAIVLSSLPAPTASKLLGSIEPESRRAVKGTMSALSDVDPLERRRAMQAFKVMFERQAVSPVATSSGDSLQIQSATHRDTPSATARVVTPDPIVTDTKPARLSPLSFLGDVEDTTLARLLTDEHPQAIAFVLASVSPDQAARVLPRLGAKLQSETMGRIGRLGEIPETAAAEVAEHFRSRLQNDSFSDQHALGRRALDAIMAAMPKSVPPETSQPLPRSSDPALATNGPNETLGEDKLPENTSQVNYPNSDLSARELTHRLRIAEETWPDRLAPSVDASAPSSHDRESEKPMQGEAAADNSVPSEAERSGNSVEPANSFASTDEIHQHLIGLSPQDLCEALGRVGTRDAMLSLCGLPVQVADAALGILPRAQSRQVRNKMNSLGSIHLREIDRAKENVANASLAALPSPSLQTPLAA